MDKIQTWFWEEYNGPLMKMAEAFAKVHPQLVKVGLEQLKLHDSFGLSILYVLTKSIQLCRQVRVILR